MVDPITGLLIALGVGALCPWPPAIFRGGPKLKDPISRTFPDGFLWGAGTSSHQVEGGNVNDWSQWELAGKTRERSGRACDHWNLEQFARDVEVMKYLGLKIYRMSIEWSRVMPVVGVINPKALGHYREMLVILKAAGIKSMVTLHHFTNPIWFAESGGWVSGDTSHFLTYAKQTAIALGNLVDYWITLNEAAVMGFHGYVTGLWPPGIKGRPDLLLRLLDNVAIAHKGAYDILKKYGNGKPVGMVHNFTPGLPVLGIAIESLLIGARDRFEKKMLRSIPMDFLGVNYYFPQRFVGPFPLLEWMTFGEKSDIGWPIYPKGLYYALMSVKDLGVPIYVTENGIADATDRLRPTFLDGHLAAVHEAILDGCPVQGYVHWSFLDNYEWAEGLSKRFGLIGVNHKTQERMVRPSALLYKYVIADNRLDPVK